MINNSLSYFFKEKYHFDIKAVVVSCRFEILKQKNINFLTKV